MERVKCRIELKRRVVEQEAMDHAHLMKEHSTKVQRVKKNSVQPPPVTDAPPTLKTTGSGAARSPLPALIFHALNSFQSPPIVHGLGF